MQGKEQRLAAIAARQFGAFTSAQAVAAGFSERTVRDRADRGQWLRPYPRVFVLPGAARGHELDAAAAWLAVGAPAAVTAQSAAYLYGLGASTPSEPQILVPGERRPRLQGVRIIRTRRWTPSHTAPFKGLRTTRLPRMVLDAAAVLEEAELAVFLDAAHRRDRSVLAKLDELLEWRCGVHGAGRLRRLVAERDPQRPIESAMETKLFSVLRWGRLPLPVPQFWVTTRSGRRRIDFAYPPQRIALETDSYGHHGSLPAFTGDRLKDNEAQEIGWSTRRITWDMLHERPHDVVWTISRALRLRPARWIAEE